LHKQLILSQRLPKGTLMDIALLALRVLAGLLFAGHGAQKLFGWFAGGLMLALGLFTPFAAALIIATMTAAVITVHAKNGPWAGDQGWELNALYGLIAFAVAGIGAGELSLDNALGLDIAGIGWALGALAAGLAGGTAAVIAGRHQPAHRGSGSPVAT
jgi:putative oxidoreductase